MGNRGPIRLSECSGPIHYDSRRSAQQGKHCLEINNLDAIRG
jgi:hypothetical protein